MIVRENHRAKFGVQWVGGGGGTKEKWHWRKDFWRARWEVLLHPSIVLAEMEKECIVNETHEKHSKVKGLD